MNYLIHCCVAMYNQKLPIIIISYFSLIGTLYIMVQLEYLSIYKPQHFIRNFGPKLIANEFLLHV